MRRIAVDIEVLVGTFQSQPLVFADLLDANPGLINLEDIDVICRVDPATRLTHYFPSDTVETLLEAAGVETTFVLFLPGASGVPTARLRSLGKHAGLLRRAD